MWLKTSLIKFRFLDEREKVDCLKYGVGKALGKQSKNSAEDNMQWYILTCKRETQQGKGLWHGASREGPLPLVRPACSELSELCVPPLLRMAGNVVFKG